MRVMFLEIDTEREWSVASLGPGFLAAVLRRNGHTAVMHRVSHGAALDSVASAVIGFKPDLIGMSLTTRQWQRARRIAGRLRELCDIPTIVGGLHPTFLPEETLAAKGIDAVCLGEGEGALLSVIEQLESGVPISAVATDNIQVRPGSRPALRDPIEPIDSVPHMARDMLDERHGVYHMTTQRGCPFPCTYCAARMFNALYGDGGNYGRRRSVESVLAEIDASASGAQCQLHRFPRRHLHHQPPRGSLDFCKRYEARCGIPFSLHARTETVNETLIAALARAGCRHITYGVESGSERLRRQVMKRHGSNQRLIEIFRRTRDAGILATANYMMGLPGETRADLAATVALHRRLEPDDFGYFVFYPYPGTPLFSVCLERGYLPDDWLERPVTHKSSILDLPDLSATDIAAAYDEWTEIRVSAALARQGARGTRGRRADHGSHAARGCGIGVSGRLGGDRCEEPFGRDRAAHGYLISPGGKRGSWPGLREGRLRRGRECPQTMAPLGAKVRVSGGVPRS